jgi:hypothetical protein
MFGAPCASENACFLGEQKVWIAREWAVWLALWGCD